MANQSAKKRASANKAAIRNLYIIVIAAHAIALCLGVGVPLLRGRPVGFRWGACVGHVLNSGAMCVFAMLIAAAARPTYKPETGELVDGGADLTIPGSLTSYYYDVVYLTAFALVGAAAVGPVFWLTHLLTAGLVAYALYSLVIAPARAAHGGDEDQDEKKDAPQARNRQERRQMVKDARKKRN